MRSPTLNHLLYLDLLLVYKSFFLLVDNSYFTFDSISFQKHFSWWNLFSSFCHQATLILATMSILLTFGNLHCELVENRKLTLPLQLPILIIALILRSSYLVTNPLALLLLKIRWWYCSICLTCFIIQFFWWFLALYLAHLKIKYTELNKNPSIWTGF